MVIVPSQSVSQHSSIATTTTCWSAGGAAARALRSMGGGGGDGQVELTQETLCAGTADPSPTKAQIMGHLMDNSLFNEDNKGEIINRCCASTEVASW